MNFNRMAGQLQDFESLLVRELRVPLYALWRATRHGDMWGRSINKNDWLIVVYWGFNRFLAFQKVP